ncbi:MAG: RNA 2',3'-cyclic phosphodiesterase [Caulobacteraceae bacterium]
MIRLFAALLVPPEIAEGLTRRQQGLPRARWRTPDQMHITLRFFGEVREDVAADLDAELALIMGRPFDLHLEGVGSFGEGAEVRAVWAGVAENPALIDLAAKCERAARRVGLPGEKRAYRPHLTLAYLRGADPVRAAAWVQGHNLLKSPPWRATWFGLYSSWLSPGGSRYEVEREYPLL